MKNFFVWFVGKDTINVTAFKHFFCLNMLVMLSSPLVAQIFLAPGGAVNDYKDEFSIDSFPIKVSGLPAQINYAFGLSKICFSITHPRVSDLKVELVSPDGSSIWLSNRNGGINGSGYANTCFRSNGFNGYIHQGIAPFEGEFIPDGRLEFINNNQNPNGIWYLLVRDLKTGLTGQLHIVSLEFGSNPMPGLGEAPCSIKTYANCQCGSRNKSKKQKCVLLPDLIVLGKFTQNQISEYAWDDPNYPGQLRFAVSVANIGAGPMETFGKGEWVCGTNPVNDSAQICPDGQFPRQKIYQRVFELKKQKLEWTDREAGTNYFDNKPGHDHYHVDNWVVFRLIKNDTDDKGNPVFLKVAQSEKVSYCLFDSGACTNNDGLCAWNGRVFGEKNLVNYGFGTYASCKSGKQGISVGGYDTYGMLYEGQFIQLPKNLPSGEYLLEVEIDPEKKYLEEDRSNNTYRQSVFISKQQ